MICNGLEHMYRTQRSYLWLWLFIVVKFSVDTAPLLLYCRIEQKVMARNFCGSLFLRFGQSSFSCCELIFAIFKTSCSNALITFSFLWERAIEIQIFNLRQYFASVKRIAVIKLHFITSGVPEMTDYSGLPSSFEGREGVKWELGLALLWTGKMGLLTGTGI